MRKFVAKAIVSAVARGAAVLLSLAIVPAAAQQPYPSKAAKILVGMTAGGPTDAAGRIVAQVLTERLKQSFVVENRAGANSLLAIQALTGSTPDGYTLLVTTSGALTMTPVVEKNLPYNPLTSFTPVALATAYPYIIVVRRDFPGNNIKDPIQYSTHNPGKLSYGSVGIYSANHLAVEWLRRLTGLDAQHVPYKGVGTLTAVIAGEIDFAPVNAGVAIPQIKAGKLKGLAVTSPARIRQADDLPTMIESGVPGFVVQPWNGIVGPANMSQEIVTKLNKEINEGLQRPDIQTRLYDIAMYTITDTPEGYKRLIAQELALWGEIVKSIEVRK